jgi:putative tricarboxylic transport membrane protein
MRRADFYIGLGLLAFALVYFRQSFMILRGFASDRLGPAFFPRMLALALAALALTLIIRAVAGRSDPSRPPAIRAGTLAIVLVVLVLYAFVLPYLGFLIATPLMLGAVIWFLGLRAWSSLAATAVGVTVVLWLVFARLLHVLLPAGFL